jgi:hypothetical protein
MILRAMNHLLLSQYVRYCVPNERVFSPIPFLLLSLPTPSYLPPISSYLPPISLLSPSYTSSLMLSFSPSPLLHSPLLCSPPLRSPPLHSPPLYSSSLTATPLFYLHCLLHKRENCRWERRHWVLLCNRDEIPEIKPFTGSIKKVSTHPSHLPPTLFLLLPILLHMFPRQ